MNKESVGREAHIHLELQALRYSAVFAVVSECGLRLIRFYILLKRIY